MGRRGEGESEPGEASEDGQARDHSLGSEGVVRSVGRVGEDGKGRKERLGSEMQKREREREETNRRAEYCLTGAVE